MTRIGLMVVAAAAMALPAVPAYAAGDDGGTTTQQCSGGLVWDARQGKCTEPAPSLIESEQSYQQGRELAEQGRYGEAILVLSRLADSGDPRVLNYLGFSHRMQGRIAVGLGYYREALRIDPDHVLARAYMGEAFLQMGDLANALTQLSEIETRCGRDCRAYAELADRIEAYRRQI